MKTIVAGSRIIDNGALVEDILGRCPWKITEVIHGACRGVDSYAAMWAKKNGIEVRAFPADWDTHGYKAGPIRNAEMAKEGDALIAIIKGNIGRGTNSMVNWALVEKLRHIWVVRI